MGFGSKSECNSVAHCHLKDNAKNRVNDLQGMLNDLQSARRDSRTSDIVILEEQVNQMLREWKSELNEPSPASSLHGGSIWSFSEDMGRLLQLQEEEDDASSALAQPVVLKSEPDAQGFHSNLTISVEDYGVEDKPLANDMTTQLGYHQPNLHPNLEYELLAGTNSIQYSEQDASPNILPNICPLPSAFLGPKCSLWDCSRPAQGSEFFQDYCSSDHAVLAISEGQPGMAPVLRPGGICFKDGQLLVALTAKTLGKDVGIPECEGATSAKSPWNAPELFDLLLLEGETIREWLFFDKPRRAFESGNRKQRSLPDYTGRGWHESRKLVMKEFGGLRRSYYMDPQPPGCFEWHLYEYEINSNGLYSLYRLELKLANEKKSPKGKVTNDSLSDLQKKMGRLTAEVPAVNRSSPDGSMKADTGTESGK